LAACSSPRGAAGSPPESARRGFEAIRGAIPQARPAPDRQAANERLAQRLWAHRDDLFTFLRQPGLDATNWRAKLAIRFGVILRKIWGGSRTWAGARAQSVLISLWRTCWQQGRLALDFLSQLLRGLPPQDDATPGLNIWPAAVALPSRDRQRCSPDRRPVPRLTDAVLG
jgi:hypothetical protein